MGRSALTLLLTAIVGAVLGLVATAAIASAAVETSAAAAKAANAKDLGVPAGYGSR